MSSSRILLVDDMDLNLVILNELLREGDFETATACNGKEAVQLSRQKKFDLILMDIQLPLLNGLDATHLIRNDIVNPLPQKMTGELHTVKIDHDNLLRIGKDNRGFVGMMQQSFRDSSNEIIGEMEHSLDRKDWTNTAYL